jgi:cysteine desulfurase
MGMKVYFDNAATTPLDKEVIEAMSPYLQEHFGNPSSIHSFGRKTRSAIESARKVIANYLNVSPSEIFFTSGGTEAINTALVQSVEGMSIKRIITSKIEHHAVLHCVEELEHQKKIKLTYVNIDSTGQIDLAHLEELLNEDVKTLVTLMHANNEIGNLLPLKKVGDLCAKYHALFHCDSTQTMGHYKMDLQAVNVHMANGAAHKFHGPKGVGFLYLNSNIKIHPFIYGGSQERNMRGGTENLYGIVGLGKAFEVAHREMEQHHHHIQELKSYMIALLEEAIPGISFNGDAKGSSLYTVLNVQFPPTENAEMMLMNLDIAGVAASGGSACTSGSNQGSHVLRNIGADMSRPSIRFSFSKYNTKQEIDYCMEKLKELFLVKV